MDLTRRALLLGAATATATACTSSAPSTPAPVDPDVALLAVAVGREQALLTAYGETPALAALRTDVTTHLERLAALPVPQPTATASTSTSSARALARATSLAHAADVPKASRTLAPVLASLAACAATHAALL